MYQVCCIGEESTKEAFSRACLEVLRLEGEPFRCEDATSITRLCGNIGRVLPPIRYVGESGGRLFLLYEDGKEKEVRGYCAIRVVCRDRAVLDVLGVHQDLRGSGWGKRLFWHARKHMRRELNPGGVIVLQAVYDHGSYLEALHKHTREHRKHVKIHSSRITDELVGPCRFWKKMGFTRSKLMFVQANFISPALIMWTQI